MSKRQRQPYHVSPQYPDKRQTSQRKGAAASLPQGRFRLHTWTVSYHDGWHKLAFNGQTVALTPKEYRLCMMFLSPLAQQQQEHASSPHDALLLFSVSKQELKQCIPLANSTLLRKNVSNVNRKLAPFGLRLITADNQYCLKAFPLDASREEGDSHAQ